MGYTLMANVIHFSSSTILCLIYSLISFSFSYDSFQFQSIQIYHLANDDMVWITPTKPCHRLPSLTLVHNLFLILQLYVTPKHGSNSTRHKFTILGFNPKLAKLNLCLSIISFSYYSTTLPQWFTFHRSSSFA